MALIYHLLYGAWTKDTIGRNLFCDIDGESTLLLGSSHDFCNSLYEMFSSSLGQSGDKFMFQMAAEDYMRMIDVSIFWLFFCILMAGVAIFLAMRGWMPYIVRVCIMMENISYFWTFCGTFFWLALILFMVIGMDPPLLFNVTHFMFFILAINITQHTMINQYKSVGECTEQSIWRSQQSYTIAAPLYIVSILRGSAAAWGIAWRRLDKSYWTPSDHSAEVVRNVTIWVTFIWVAFLFCVGFTALTHVRQAFFGDAVDEIQKQSQYGSLGVMGLLAITVWEPFFAVWGVDKWVDEMNKDESRPFRRWLAGMLIWWRQHLWLVRYIVDFGLPLTVLCGVPCGVGLLTLAAYSTTVQGFRA
jgi:hypothetical protein